VAKETVFSYGSPGKAAGTYRVGEGVHKRFVYGAFYDETASFITDKLRTNVQKRSKSCRCV
jgi:hypothetical protein